MDQDLKQRLVGAIVITALATIFVPMLFDDPIDQSGKNINELTIPQLPVQSINVNSSKLAKSVDDVINLPEPKALKEQLVEQKKITKKERWFLQVGTFGQKSNADALQKKLEVQGFNVSNTKVSSEKGASYKIRVGPAVNKTRAENMKIRIDKLFNIKSIITSDG